MFAQDVGEEGGNVNAAPTASLSMSNMFRRASLTTRVLRGFNDGNYRWSRGEKQQERRSNTVASLKFLRAYAIY